MKSKIGICQFKLPISSLISSSRLPMTVASLLGIAGLALALKDSKFGKLCSSGWLPTTPKLPLVPGLQNLGNNCFLNVILQVYNFNYVCVFLILSTFEYEMMNAVLY